ncbi:ubiquitin-conjugating enzyme E2 7-like protein [Jimgerdemannia flammicorona]|uniref:Ubiquitin-conjugating enzyme E2 7-like protein n=1 Tax=Jimgerdemannia flammicorona TaxID=994334 RepID=A0A433A0X7_9FUNG|nr:ubiquitin-conjugating enzyme E2 7-like protein [Jimgerdemannia flammicorona]
MSSNLSSIFLIRPAEALSHHPGQPSSFNPRHSRSSPSNNVRPGHFTPAQATERIVRSADHFEQLTKHPVDGFSAGLVEDNNIYETYPLMPPKLKFVNDMWHPNVYPDGEVCISILVRAISNVKACIAPPNPRINDTDHRDSPEDPPPLPSFSIHSCTHLPSAFMPTNKHPPGEDKWGYEKANERWLPVHTVETILISVISMLSSPNDESPANIEAAKEWREDYPAFKKRVQRIVRRSAEML